MSDDVQLGGEVAGAVRRLMLTTQRSEVALSAALHVGSSDLAAIEQLAEHGPMGPAALARLLGISAPSASVLVDRLEAAGHARRRRDGSDRRRVSVEVTGNAVDSLIGLLVPLIDEIDALAAGLSASDRATVLRFLNDVVTVVEGHEFR